MRDTQIRKQIWIAGAHNGISQPMIVPSWHMRLLHAPYRNKSGARIRHIYSMLGFVDAAERIGELIKVIQKNRDPSHALQGHYLGHMGSSID